MSKVAKLMGMSLDDIIKQEKKTKPAPSKKAALANATTQRAKAKREATLAAKRGQTATAQKAKQAAKDVKVRAELLFLAPIIFGYAYPSEIRPV